MDKTLAGLLAAAATVVAATPGHSAPLPPTPDAVLHARSYAELLRPVPNAVTTLHALDEGGVEQVQLGPILRDLVRPQHHHHHHRYYRRTRHHHHHHHHGYRNEYRR